jgi:hypothetical protein
MILSISLSLYIYINLIPQRHSLGIIRISVLREEELKKTGNNSEIAKSSKLARLYGPDQC